MISAVILAAGRSQRMGRPKMALPWGDTTVIGQVVQTLVQAEVKDILVVTGGYHQEVESALQGLPVWVVYNPRFAEGEMVSSLQTGLANLPEAADAALVVLGDQPKIQAHVVSGVIAMHQAQHADLVVPSYQMRRGHPWLIDRRLWGEVQALGVQHTLRDLLQAHASEILYLPVETDSVLIDLDTPGDYERERPKDENPRLPGLG